jgi:signal transduction histidine kinase
MERNPTGPMFTRRAQRNAARDAGPPPRIGTAVARFMLGSLLAIAVVVIGGFLALRSVAVKEAVRDTRERVEAEARLVQTIALSDALLRGDAVSIAQLDEVVHAQVLNRSIVRVKIWSRDGRILYSDDHSLAGRRFMLAPDDRRLFDGAPADAELSDLSKPENRLERGQGKLLEAYSIVHTPNGTPLLFEIYQRFSSVTASGHRLLRAEAPPLFGGLLVLLLFQAPLAWSLGRRLQRGHRDRAALLANAVEASAAERRRIASDLHDGVVQNVAGVAFGLAPLARAASAAASRRTRRSCVGRSRSCARGSATCARAGACRGALDPPRAEPPVAGGDAARDRRRRQGLRARRSRAFERERPRRPDAAGGARRAGRRRAVGALAARRRNDGHARSTVGAELTVGRQRQQQRQRERYLRRARGVRGPRRGRRRGRAALSVRRQSRSPRAAAAAGFRARTPAGRCRGSGRRSSARARAG